MSKDVWIFLIFFLLSKRSRASRLDGKELGPKFDIRSFHDEMLDGGTLPLDLLEARTDKWIAQQKAK